VFDFYYSGVFRVAWYTVVTHQGTVLGKWAGFGRGQLAKTLQAAVPVSATP
jgi:hypothetical protein